MMSPRIITPQRLSPGSQLSAIHLNRLAEAIESQAVNGTQTTRGTFPYSRRPVMAAAGLDLSLFAFGATTSGAIVSVNGGEVQHGARTIIDVPAANFTITLDNSYIWVQYVIGSGVATLQGPSTTRPQNDDTTIRRWLYKISFGSGVAEIDIINHVGSLFIDSIYA